MQKYLALFLSFFTGLWNCMYVFFNNMVNDYVFSVDTAVLGEALPNVKSNLNDFGGFYFDTDLELLKPIDVFLANDFTTGFIDRSPDVLLNMCFLGAAKGCRFVADMLAEYDSLDFVLPNGELDQTPNVVRMARYLERRAGRRFTDAREKLELAPGCTIYPAEHFNSADGYAVHHYCASWLDDWIRKLYFSFGRHKLVRFKLRKGCSSAFPEALPGEEVVASLRLGPRRRLCITRYAGR